MVGLCFPARDRARQRAAQRYSTAHLQRTGRFIVLFIIATESRLRRYGPRCRSRRSRSVHFWRCLVAVCVLFPLAFPMGMLFRWRCVWSRLTARHAIPWFWSINGITSRARITLTRGIALLFGLTAATAVALAIYGVAALCLAGFPSREPESYGERSPNLEPTFLPPNENRSPYQRRTISGEEVTIPRWKRVSFSALAALAC